MVRYTIPNMYSAKQKLYRGIDRFRKKRVATHISDVMDRLTDCVGQCTICRSILSDLYEATQSCHWSVTLQKLKMGTSLESLQNLIFLTLNVAYRMTFLQLLFHK